MIEHNGTSTYGTTHLDDVLLLQITRARKRQRLIKERRITVPNTALLEQPPDVLLDGNDTCGTVAVRTRRALVRGYVRRAWGTHLRMMITVRVCATPQ